MRLRSTSFSIYLDMQLWWHHLRTSHNPFEHGLNPENMKNRNICISLLRSHWMQCVASLAWFFFLLTFARTHFLKLVALNLTPRASNAQTIMMPTPINHTAIHSLCVLFVVCFFFVSWYKHSTFSKSTRKVYVFKENDEPIYGTMRRH